MAFNIFGKRDKGAKKTPPVTTEVTEVVQSGPTMVASSSPVLRSFHVSEKSTRGLAMNHYTFIVADKATKTQVRDAVKQSYKVDVVKVNLIRLPAKQRSLGRRAGWVQGKRKAIVVLKKGQSIAAAQP